MKKTIYNDANKAKTYHKVLAFIEEHDPILVQLLFDPEQFCGMDEAVVNIMEMYAKYKMLELTRLQKENEELLAKIAQIKASLPDNKIRDLNPIWVRDEIVKRLTNK